MVLPSYLALYGRFENIPSNLLYVSRFDQHFLECFQTWHYMAGLHAFCHECHDNMRSLSRVNRQQLQHSTHCHDIHDKMHANLPYNARFENIPKNVRQTYRRVAGLTVCSQTCHITPGMMVVPSNLLHVGRFDRHFVTCYTSAGVPE